MKLKVKRTRYNIESGNNTTRLVKKTVLATMAVIVIFWAVFGYVAWHFLQSVW